MASRVKREFLFTSLYFRAPSTLPAIARGQHRPISFLWIAIQRRQMAHLAARPRLQLSVEMQLHAGKRAGRAPIGFAISPQIAQQVRHRRGTMHFR